MSKKLKYSGQLAVIISIAFVQIITSCKTYVTVSNQNLAYQYNKSEQQLRPDFIVYHINDTLTRIFFKLTSSELLYLKSDTTAKFKALISAKYRLLSSYDSYQAIDSGNVFFEDPRSEDTRKNIILFFDVRAKYQNDYVLDVRIRDENRLRFVKAYLNIYKKNHYNRQNYLLTDTSGILLFRNYIRSYETLRLKYDKQKNGRLLVKCYFRDFPIAPPPFTENLDKSFNPQPDSIFWAFLSDSSTIELKLPKKGFYHFLADTSTFEGYTLYNHYDDFPKITTAELMVQPMRYLTSKNEFQKISLQKNKKDGVDEFWLQSGGNPERARELIRRYYNRVQDANQYFTSYTEGWKTDRGMIFTVFGPPNYVYRTKNGENWIYGEENNINSLSFTFVKVDNPFTDNDYLLVRSLEYRQSWYNAVEVWRR